MCRSQQTPEAGHEEGVVISRLHADCWHAGHRQNYNHLHPGKLLTIIHKHYLNRKSTSSTPQWDQDSNPLSFTFLSLFPSHGTLYLFSPFRLCLYLTFSSRFASFMLVGSVCCWPATPTLLLTTSCWSWNVSGSGFSGLGRDRRSVVCYVSQCKNYSKVNKSSRVSSITSNINHHFVDVSVFTIGIVSNNEHLGDGNIYICICEILKGTVHQKTQVYMSCLNPLQFPPSDLLWVLSCFLPPGSSRHPALHRGKHEEERSSYAVRVGATLQQGG